MTNKRFILLVSLACAMIVGAYGHLINEAFFKEKNGQSETAFKIKTAAENKKPSNYTSVNKPPEALKPSEIASLNNSEDKLATHNQNSIHLINKNRQSFQERYLKVRQPRNCAYTQLQNPKEINRIINSLHREIRSHRQPKMKNNRIREIAPLHQKAKVVDGITQKYQDLKRRRFSMKS